MDLNGGTLVGWTGTTTSDEGTTVHRGRSLHLPGFSSLSVPGGTFGVYHPPSSEGGRSCSRGKGELLHTVVLIEGRPKVLRT